MGLFVSSGTKFWNLIPVLHTSIAEYLSEQLLFLPMTVLFRYLHTSLQPRRTELKVAPSHSIPQHFPRDLGKQASCLFRSLVLDLLCQEGRTIRLLLAGGGLNNKRAVLTVLFNRFPCLILSCFCSAKSGGLEYLRYFSFPVSLGTKHFDYQTPSRSSSRTFWSGQPSHPPYHFIGSCLPSPPCKCWQNSIDLNIPRMPGIGLDIQP